MTARYEGDAELYPQRVMLGTETYPRQVFENWDLVERLPAVIGEFTWTGWDYIGELGETPYPAWQNTAGDIDAFGFRRPVSYWREIVFGLRTSPYIAVRPPEAHGTPREFGPWKFTDAVASWTWDVPVGTPMTVEVYTPDGKVELLLNDGRVAEGVSSSCHALFEVPYEPGVLRAVAENGEVWELSTTDAAALHPVVEDLQRDGWLITQVHMEDAAGVWALGDGREYDCARDGWRLVAAGSEASVPSELFSSGVRLAGLGLLAVYHKA